MRVKRITWSVDSVAKGRFYFTLYGNGMEMKISRDLSAEEIDRALGAMHIGGRKYHNKSYGGGIVFQSYCLKELETAIDKMKGE